VEQVNLSSSTPTYLTYTPSDSSWLATNNAGVQLAFWRYDAFGNLATRTPDSPFGYSGQYTDATTGLVNDRARFYESQTGSFTTRDPAFAATDQAYAYASQDPVNRTDPSGQLSLGVCAGFAVHVLVVQLGAGDCLTQIVNGPNKGQIGIVATPIAGLGLGLAAGIQYYYQVTNADSLDQIGGPFTYVAATAALGLGAEGTFFWNNHWSGHIIIGADVGIEAGAGLSGSLGESYSFVHEFGGWFSTTAAHAAWDLAVPGGFAVQSWVNKAKVVEGHYNGASQSEGATACST
jgi:RHS repeat-associated protein